MQRPIPPGHLRFLFAMFQGGGNIPLILPIAGRLVARGHQVRILAGPGIRADRLPVSARFRERIAATGAGFVPFPEPAVHPFDDDPSPSQPAYGELTAAETTETRRAQVLLWSPVWAEAVAREGEREPADVLAADFELLGALIAAETARVPAAALVHNVPWRPLPGIPPRGSGALPEPTPFTVARDEAGRARWTEIQVAEGLPPVNRARAQAGLAPLRAPYEQYDRVERVLVLTPAAFDFPADRLPDNVRYVGTPFDDAGAPAWNPPWPVDDARPLVIASLSTLQQGQRPILQRVCAALGQLPVRALMTLGPSLDPAGFTAPPNVVLETFVPYAAVLPLAAAMVTQCGLGTVMKALAHGVPLVCIPVLGDQPDNAARIVARGAGVRLTRDASVEQIREAIHQVLTEPQFRQGARRLASALATADATQTAAEELESLSDKH